MNGRAQAKLYYLYMMSDGEVSAGEKKIFTSVCKELSLDAADKKEVIKECESIQKDEKLSCIEVLEKNVEEGYMYGILDIDLDGYASKKDKAAVLWNLINLGYSDTHFTFDEKEVVGFLCNHWEISETLYQEMIDVAETMLALVKHKKWIEDTLPDTESKQIKIRQIKKDLKFTHDNIKTTISELD